MRRSASAHNPGVSLFPFLAVLICTMGVMMLLLVIINRPGSGASMDDSEASTDAPPGAHQATPEELDGAREALVWKIEQLRSSREQTAADLEDRRLRLGAVEEHMRKLRDNWNSVKRAAGDLTQAAARNKADAQYSAAKISDLASELAATKREIEVASQHRAREAPSFAIIPYDGPNGTRRRPIYIECGPKCVTLQPEGIILKPSDFDGPDGPGNPLASTLRAARDYMAAQNAASGVPGEPYPLLIVRPNGIIAFSAARAALASWKTEFGYELIDQDQPMTYPQPDEKLAQVEQTALADARSRYAWFAQTRTGKKQMASARPVYRASSSGGGVVQEGARLVPEVDDAAFGFSDDEPPTGGGRGAAGSGQVGLVDPLGITHGGGSRGSGAVGQTGSGSPTVFSGGNAGAGNRYASAPVGSGGYSAERSTGAAAGGYGAQGTTPYGSSGAYRGGSAGGSPGEVAGPGSDGAAASPTSGAEQGPASPQAGTTTNYEIGAHNSVAMADDGGEHGPAFQPGPGEYVDRPDFKPPPKKPDDDNKPKPHSLAERRGRDWSLPTGVRKSTAVSRPIHIECRGDQMIIKPDAGNNAPQTIAFKGRTEESVDQLVAAIWQHTKGWGLAGRQMYWHPVLILEMGPSGEARFGELQALMADSGLEITRK